MVATIKTITVHGRLFVIHVHNDRKVAELRDPSDEYKVLASFPCKAFMNEKDKRQLEYAAKRAARAVMREFTLAQKVAKRQFSLHVNPTELAEKWLAENKAKKK